MKFSWPWAIAFAGIAAAITLSPIMSTLAVIGCAVWALFGPAHTLRALTVSALIAYANPALVTIDAQAGVLFRIVLILGAVGVLPRTRSGDVRLVWPVWLFSAVAAVTSALASPALGISLMKVMTFAIAVTTILVACNKLEPNELARLETWFLTLGATVVALSALVLLNPAAAYLRNERGFQGVLSHPQSLGTLLAPFAARLVAGLVLMRGRFGLIQAVTTVAFLATMFATQARTGAVALIVGVGCAVLMSVFTQRRYSQADTGRLVVVFAVGIVATGIIGLMTVKVADTVTAFVMKGSTAGDVTEAFYASRGGRAVDQWRHFLDRPFTGNGFGVYADGEFPTGVVEFAGIPISASVEKGFVPTAVLEETGVFGGLCFVLLVVSLSRLACRNRDPSWIAMFAACLGVNLGEAVIFSPGGIGIVVWLLIGLAVAPSRHLQGRTPARASSSARRSVALRPAVA